MSTENKQSFHGFNTNVNISIGEEISGQALSNASKTVEFARNKQISNIVSSGRITVTNLLNTVKEKFNGNIDQKETSDLEK